MTLEWNAAPQYAISQIYTHSWQRSIAKSARFFCCGLRPIINYAFGCEDGSVATWHKSKRNESEQLKILYDQLQRLIQAPIPENNLLEATRSQFQQTIAMLEAAKELEPLTYYQPRFSQIITTLQAQLQAKATLTLTAPSAVGENYPGSDDPYDKKLCKKTM